MTFTPVCVKIVSFSWEREVNDAEMSLVVAQLRFWRQRILE